MKVSGKVTWVNGGPAKHAVISLYPASGKAGKTASTNEKGMFELEDVAAGDWTLGVKHLDGRQPARLAVTVEQDVDKPACDMEIAHYERTIDQERGTNMLWGFIALLILLLTGWFLAFADKGSEGDGSALLYMVQEARTANDALDKDGTKTALSRLFAQMEERLVSRDISVADDDRRMKLAEVVAERVTALDGLDPNEASALDVFKAQTAAALTKISAGVPRIVEGDLKRGARGLKGMNWLVASNVTLTIFFWALIGTLIRLIMTIQYYLYKHTFYRQGIVQHYSLLVAVPVMTFAMIKLLSLVNISAEVGSDKAVLLDFSNPQIMAIGAFLLALAPWALWKRLLSISSGIGSGRPQGQQGQG